MKILKYALGIIALLVLVFILIGAFSSEVAYKNVITVNKPLAESWAVSQDEERMADWLDGFQKIEHVSGTPGTVGAVSDVYFIDDGQEMVIRETITDIVPNESITMTFENDFMNMDYILRMSEMEGKTKISSSTTAVGNGMFSKSLMALMSGTFVSQEETNLFNLKRTIEENTKNYFPVVEEPKEETEEQE
ncbi:SRPBCC family protein [uncultured Eudoraea sp.]|uniref:SRPBCC family protein n=1 Tax=uncultured Eudoraea sp. TaxID=1035614 RepID=UPI00262EB0D8|nr:SRPBCC family protein [uncultured Eudoraea sp.]